MARFAAARACLLALLLGAAAAAAPEGVSEASLAADDQCASGDEACSLNALQRRGLKATQAGLAKDEAPNTCAGTGCGHYLKGHSCQCNAKCGHYGNCCADYSATCLGHHSHSEGHHSPAAPASSGGAKNLGCMTHFSAGGVVDAHKKGMALDDTTFELCSGEIPAVWPHTNTPITSVRLFKAWGVAPPTVFHTNRTAAWINLKNYAEKNNVRYLIGTSVGCDKAGDAEEWRLAKEFMGFVGAKHIMGLAIGNELELLFQKSGQYQNPACLKGLFGGRGYEKEFVRRVAEMDEMPGFSSVPVTAVFGMYVMAGKPFVNSWNSGINTFLSSVWRRYRNRFVFSFNLYPYFDPASRCSRGSIHAATDFHHGMVPNSARAVRQRMAMIGAGNARLWVGETGWSTPKSASVAPSVANCAAFSSESTFKSFYTNFLKWNTAGARVDHVFYFTIHDSKNFDAPEHFGLLGKCGSTQCKLQH